MNTKKMLHSFTFAWRGLAYVVRNENNAKFHTVATLCVVVLALCIRVSVSDWLWLGTAISIVWICEIINTAIERVVDLLSDERKPQAGLVKDISAAAVFAAAIHAVLVGVLVFVKYLS